MLMWHLIGLTAVLEIVLVRSSKRILPLRSAVLPLANINLLGFLLRTMGGYGLVVGNIADMVLKASALGRLGDA
jgi:hypothetical protein